MRNIEFVIMILPCECDVAYSKVNNIMCSIEFPVNVERGAKSIEALIKANVRRIRDQGIAC